MNGIDDDYTNDETIGGKKHNRRTKRHGNASLRAWVTFVKKVQKDEKLSYRDAMMRAKVRKDKGEKWRGGNAVTGLRGGDTPMDIEDTPMDVDNPSSTTSTEILGESVGGRRRRRSHKRRGSKRRGSRRHTRRHR